ncbi:MAG: AAA family ATPase [Lachnospiraceae bacterium]|nr:AAA family ATPase [Lachnospiraceae bacterium]
MNIKRAKEEIKDSIQAYLLRDAFGEYEIPTMGQRPVLLLGAPGIGKTQIMEQIARECKIGLVSYTITHHTRQSAIGLPFIAERSYGGKKQPVTEYTMSEIVASIYDKMEKTGLQEGILFIDEINCVSETLAPAMLQFLQCKTFGSHAIPRGWIIVAAGNPPEYNKSVREFDVVTMDRVKKILVEPDFSVWKEYAYGQRVHPAVLSYLNIRPKYFYQMEQTVDGKEFVTPRGWEDLSRILYVYEKLGKRADREVVSQYLQHPRVAKDFANYLELYKKYHTDYEVEAIFQGKISQGVLKKVAHAAFDERLSLVGLLLDRCAGACKKAQEAEGCLALLLEQLKAYQRIMAEDLEETDRTESNREPKPASVLGDVLAEVTNRWQREREAELLSREEDYALRRVQELLEQYVQRLKIENLSNRDQAFARIRDWFGEERENYEKLCNQAGEALERSFDFLEVAFGVSQEMTVFLTELNVSRDCVEFLQTWECERYYQYNRELLPGESHKELLRRIEQL